MSRREVSTTWDKQKTLWAVVLLLVVGYVYGRPTLEKMIGRPLPSFGLNPGEQVDEPANRTGEQKKTGDDAREFFTDLGRNRLKSPAGLVYGMGPGGEHRVEHVMLHAQDDPARAVQSVFNGTREEILELVDEAWMLAKKGGRGIDISTEDDRVAYTVSMNRVIGYEGGKTGKSKNFPKLKRLRLIIEDEDELISAYPFR